RSTIISRHLSGHLRERLRWTHTDSRRSMSGICGVFNASPEVAPAAAASAMLVTLKHRGPDGASLCADRAAGAALGHTHLDAFAGPGSGCAAFAATGDVAIAVDGSITNAAALLHQRALAPGADGMNPDVQAAMAAYLGDGEDCLTKFDGPFSLALWDRQRQTLLLARDKLGERS